LAGIAWRYWTDQLTKPDTDRAQIARHLKTIFADQPGAFDRPEREFLRWLDLSLVPSKAKPGSIEAMIDDLINVTHTKLRTHGVDPDPRYLKVVLLGFEAVPVLIAHLEDDRLTRETKLGFNNFSGYHYRVRDVVSDLLQGLAGEDLGKDWVRRQQGWSVAKADAEAWWKKAREVGDEAYLQRHVLGNSAQAQWPNELMLEIITKQYPQQLPGVYRKLLHDRPQMVSWPVARAISASSLPDETKRRVLLEAAASQNLAHRRYAFWELRTQDPAMFSKLLAATLGALPATPAGEYWNCPEAAFASLVAESTDPHLWAILLKAAKRSDVGLRREFLRRMHDYRSRELSRKHRLSFLAQFLTDETVRDVSTNPEKFGGPAEGFGEFPRLEVRNYAALVLSRILKLKADPNSEWTAEDWAKLRLDVRKALDCEGIP
jgi:hypothetical protein